MPEVEDRRRVDRRRDLEEHERRAGVFWGICATLVAVFTLAAPAGAKILHPGGIAFFAAWFAANLAYATRIAIGPPRTTAEQLGAASVATAALGLQQYLAGSLPMLSVLLPLFVLGAVAVLEHAQRLLYLPVVIGAALSPLLYVHVDARSVDVHLVLMFVLVMEMALLGDFGDRLRRQRHQLAEAEAQASARAVTDELTGLGNRRALVARIAPTAVADPENPVTVVYCDLDGFKPFNDRFGHAAGDALLRRLGQALDSAARPHGTAYRVGGDEFCVLLDGRPPADGPLVAGLVAALTEDGPGYAIRCSHGVAATPEDAVDLAGALQVADRRMYLLKRGRRQPAADPVG